MSLWKLLVVFLKIGLFSIGGGYATIPLIQEAVVLETHWLSLQEFTDIITISQMTPGPLAVNASTFVGIRVAGVPGAVVATFGCVISGFVISLLLLRFFGRHRQQGGVAAAFQGLKAASTGLIAASACTILMIAFWGVSSPYDLTGQWNLRALLLFAIALFFLRKKKWNPIVVILLSGAAGLLLYN